MKYVFVLLTAAIVYAILLPIIIIRWDDDGLEEVMDGIKTLYGVDD